jgi:hypothetical protein
MTYEKPQVESTADVLGIMGDKDDDGGGYR